MDHQPPRGDSVAKLAVADLFPFGEARMSGSWAGENPTVPGGGGYEHPLGGTGCVDGPGTVAQSVFHCFFAV